MILALFGMFLLQVVVPASWGMLGTLPRTQAGLVGILFAPLLHYDLAHVVANAVPLFVLLLLLFSDGRYRPAPTLAAIWLASGTGTWVIGRGGAVHIGASGIVFGLVSYLMVSGVLMRSWRALFVSLVVFALFGGVLYGVLPQAGPISWEGHLCGALAGVWSARYTHSNR
jgi:membrane associated rhomboid family serine protease